MAGAGGGATATTRFGYDGVSLIAEYDGANTLLRRYVHGPGTDAPLVWYEGAGLTDRRWYHADERGSVIGISNASATVTNINAYDEYGIPQSTNVGRFGYTGQTWLPEIGMNYYKARMYSPTLGRFMQTDPIGYGDGMNWYAYVGSDPVNGRDPSGLTTYTCDIHGRCTDPFGNPVNPNTGLNGGDSVSNSNGTFTSNGNGGGDRALIVNGGRTMLGNHEAISGFLDRNSSSSVGGGGNALERVTPADLADANKKMREACGGAQNSAACAAAKQAYQSAFRTINQQNPLPPIPKFEIVRPELGPLLLGIVGCGAGVITGGGGGFGAVLTAAGCAYTARDFGNFIIPEQRRVP